MKATKLWIATGSMLVALLGLMLALAWWQPVPIQADVSTEPLALPPPYLSDDDVADAPYNWSYYPTMMLDGTISPGEYAGAGKVTFPGHGGDVEVFFEQNAATLFVAFDLPAPNVAPPTSHADIYLDTDLDGDNALDNADYLLRVRADGSLAEFQGSAGVWTAVAPVGWSGAAAPSLAGGGWQAEFVIPFAKLGLSAGTFQPLGLALGTGNGGLHLWPAGAIGDQPLTWGTLVSSSDWDIFYWKPGPWEDYAPSGMPDFDQRNPMLPNPGTHCGPVAMANSLWWFDSKFETPDHAPRVISDTYRLVTSYEPGVWDDHDDPNAMPLVLDLATNYFNTDDVLGSGAWRGTRVTDMYTGTLNYLRDHGLWDDYTVTLVERPAYEWVADEVQRSEDVVLLLGFWQEDPSGAWVRLGGHYVTVAGVDPRNGTLAFSDPIADAAEVPPGVGRVLDGNLLAHPPYGTHPPEVHDDAGNISHDVWWWRQTPSPGGDWGLWNQTSGLDYYFSLSLLGFDPLPLVGANPHPAFVTVPIPPDRPEFVWTEVEYALAVSPFDWKASGEWLPGDEPVYGTWQPWPDYAPSGVPDFDQKQGAWQNPFAPQWTFCGPAAAANSLWWFDSKFEPAPVPPPAPNDNYPLVTPYGPWDDHDPLNVDDPATVWPPGGEFVEELAIYFDTDGLTTGTVHAGTYFKDLVQGIDAYLIDHGLRQGYVLKPQDRPDFWWVAEQVEVSEDVILLMGFWQTDPTGAWVRLGGHYVTVPGVDKQGGFVAFSDPWFDRMGLTWPYAGIGSLAGWPSYMGRVADGTLIPHPPYAVHPPEVHNDAGNVSHDIYNVVRTDSPGGVWGPEEYAEPWTPELDNFLGQNETDLLTVPGPLPVRTEVDFALAVSPVADVWIDKEVFPGLVLPGDWLTITIHFGNEGSLLAENVVVTDILPVELVNPSWVYWTSSGGAVTERPGYTYVWDVPDLAWKEWGVITLTAQVDPNLVLVNELDVLNVAEIHTSTEEQYQITALPNADKAVFTIVPPPVWDKMVDGLSWFPGIGVTVATSDTIEIDDVISATRPFTLTETWDPAHLALDSLQVDPNGTGTVVAGSGGLTWTVTAGTWATLTKEFVVQPCTWTGSVLTETLEFLGHTWDQPVEITKEPPVLEIDSDYDAWVFPNTTATFTLTYLNSGGDETGVWILNEFPISAPIVSAVPAPTISATNGISARWDIGYLGQGDAGTIVVNVAISEAVKYPDTLDIWDGIFDHVDVLMDEVTTTFEVTKVIVAHIYLPILMRDYTPAP